LLRIPEGETLCWIYWMLPERTGIRFERLLVGEVKLSAAPASMLQVVSPEIEWTPGQILALGWLGWLHERR
jgi:hypothetical protein